MSVEQLTGYLPKGGVSKITNRLFAGASQAGDGQVYTTVEDLCRWGQPSARLLHPPLPSVGVSIGMERGCSRFNGLLADGQVGPAVHGRQRVRAVPRADGPPPAFGTPRQLIGPWNPTSTYRPLEPHVNLSAFGTEFRSFGAEFRFWVNAQHERGVLADGGSIDYALGLSHGESIGRCEHALKVPSPLSELKR